MCIFNLLKNLETWKNIEKKYNFQREKNTQEADMKMNRINGRVDTAEEKLSELEDRRKEIFLGNKKSIRDLWDNLKWHSILWSSKQERRKKITWKKL